MDFLNSSVFTLDGESEHDTTANSRTSDESSSRVKGKVAARRRYSESSEENVVDASEESWYEEDSFVVNDEEEIEYETDASDHNTSCSDNEAEDAEEGSAESGSEGSDEEEEQSMSDEETSSESGEVGKAGLPAHIIRNWYTECSDISFSVAFSLVGSYGG
jgi:hypothetical protein